MGRVRMLLADDHAMVRGGFAKLLEPQYEVVGEVGDGLALLDAAGKLQPDVVLVDIGMPLLNGLDASRELKRRWPEIKVVILTMNKDTDVAAEALSAGASAYLLKSSEPKELMQAIHEVVRRRTYVTPEISNSMKERFISGPEEVNRQRKLTVRQLEVLQMFAEGLSLQEIADRLQITHRTARFHKYHIMTELAITSNAELVQYAVKHGIVS